MTGRTTEAAAPPLLAAAGVLAVMSTIEAEVLCDTRIPCRAVELRHRTSV